MNRCALSFATALSLLTPLAFADTTSATLNVDSGIPTQTIRLTLTADRIQKITPADPKTVPANQFVVIYQPRVQLSEKFVFVDNVDVVRLPFAAQDAVRSHLCRAYGFQDSYSVVGYDLNEYVKGFRLASSDKPGRVVPVQRDNEETIRQLTCLP